MKYIVFIDRNSLVGKSYARYFPAVQVGEEAHVAMLCTHVDWSNPAYIFVRTEATLQGASRQALYLPQGSVFLVKEYGDDEKQPVGFV